MSSDSDSEPEMFDYNPDEFENNAFNYQDPYLTPVISKAVLDNNLESFRQLIAEGHSINNPDNNGNLPLHLAVVNNAGVEMLAVLLTHPNIDLNYKNYEGYTPLLFGLHKDGTDSVMITNLLDAGCDVNGINNMEETALHLGIVNHYPENILRKLIEKGANINAQDDAKCTPLHRAVQYNNKTAIYMLLYYNADVTISCINNRNPFMYAIHRSHEMARILFDYYDFNHSDEDGYHALLLAAESQNPIAIDLIRAGVDVICEHTHSQHVLQYSILHSNCELFKELLPKMNSKNFIGVPFLHSFFDKCRFVMCDWVQCLYLLLNSPFITELINPSVTSDAIAHTTEYLFSLLISNFHYRGVEKNDRLKIICAILSYGGRVNLHDVYVAYQFFGVHEELEILIQIGYVKTIKDKSFKHCYPFLTYLLMLEDNFNRKSFLKMFETEFEDYKLPRNKQIAEENILHILEYFSLPLEVKQKLKSDPLLNDDIKEKLNSIPELPSLTEMCRDQARKFIKQTHKITESYHFYDIVKKLELPEPVKNIIILKRPLYAAE